MKKGFLLALLLTACISMPLFAQSASESSTKAIWDHGDNVSSIAYRNVRIYKIYDSANAYIVLYEKQGVKIGQVAIPKTWTQQEPRKLVFRNKPAELQPYMTVMYQNGEFYKVWITVSPDRTNSVWGVAKNGTSVNADIESLDIQF